MSGTSTGIAIVFPAWFLGSTDLELHATALFLGNTDTTTFNRKDIEEVLRWEGLDPGAVRVTGSALFGKEGRTPVLTLESDVLRVEQEWIERELEMYGITSPSTFGFNPHVTIAKELARPYLPKYIQLESPVLWWGSERQYHSKHMKAQVSA